MRYPDRTISSNSEPAPVLADLPIFDLIKDTSLDQMHAVDIGVFLKSYFTMMFIDSTLPGLLSSTEEIQTRKYNSIKDKFRKGRVF